MSKTQRQQFFRAKRYAYPWLAGTVILLAGAYMLANYGRVTEAVIAFAAGLIVAALGLRLVRRPAVRVAGNALTLSDPRGLSLKTHTYSLQQIKRITIVARARGIPNRLRRDVLMVNLSGVSDDDIDAFVRAVREHGVQVDR